MPQDNLEVVRRFIDQREDLPAVLAFLDPRLEWVPLRAATEGA